SESRSPILRCRRLPCGTANPPHESLRAPGKRRPDCPPPAEDLLADRYSLRGPRQREQEFRTAIRLRFHPDPAAVAMHDLLADREADAAARILAAAVQALKHSENLRLVIRLDADAVVFHRN